MFPNPLLGSFDVRSVQYVAFVSDNENSTLRRFVPAAEFIHVDDERELDKIFAQVENNDLIVIDARAASTDMFLNYFKEVRLFDFLKDLDARLTLVSPINHEA